MRTQHYAVPTSPVVAESWMNGAALVTADGQEIPITDAMIREALDALAQEDD